MKNVKKTPKKTAAKPVTKQASAAVRKSIPDVQHITPAGRSVFYDLFPEEEAAELEIRARLLVALRLWLEESGRTQTAAAEKLGVTQARISDMQRGKINKFSIAQLIRLAARAGLKPRIDLANAA